MSQTNSNNPVPNFFLASADDFKKIPGSPIAYWMSDVWWIVFEKFPTVGGLSEVRKGLVTLNDARFIRNWFEVSFKTIKFGTEDREESKQLNCRWFPVNKGGGYRKWYGFNEFIINWKNDGEELKAYIVSKYNGGSYTKEIRSEKFYFKENITWGSVTSGPASFRYTEKGFLFSSGGSCIFTANNIHKMLMMLNSKIAANVLEALTPTLNYVTGDIIRIPVCSFNNISKKDILLILEKAKKDWDSYETSWDFSILPLLDFNQNQPTLKATYKNVSAHWQSRTLETQRLEEENNRIFIEAYGLQDELTPDVPLSEITLTCNPHYRYGGNKNEEELEAVLQTDTIKELISYAMGCMMGRYSLDKPSLVYAHSGNIGFDPSAYKIFPADNDGIIPVMDEEWFPDDATNRFVKFIKTAWPPETLDENLQFIADSLGPKTNEMPVDTIRRYISTGFFKDHLKTYKKRPIYWLFSSGKLKAFECLVYLHRYNESTLSRMRSSYVTPLQGNFSARLEYLQNELDAAVATTAKRKIQKKIDLLKKKMAELKTFDDNLRHYADMRISLDLDDGVKLNYGKFGNLLAETKAITVN